MLLSIIIPVYGVEKYIQELIQTLFPQLTDEVECIFIDDGCKDKSIDILKQSLNDYKSLNVKIIHQENAGISAARNTGLKYTNGEYITFLDPDDFVYPQYVKTILDAISEYHFDIMHFNAIQQRYKKKNKILGLVEKYEYKIISESTLLDIYQKNHWYPWLRVFKQHLIKNITFPVGYILEDMYIFSSKIYTTKLKLYTTPQALLFYRYRPESATNNKKAQILLNSYEHGIQEFGKHRNNLEYYKLYTYANFLIYALNAYRKMNYVDYKNFTIKYNDDIKFIRRYISKLGFRFKHIFMVMYPKTFFYIKNFYKPYRFKKTQNNSPTLK